MYRISLTLTLLFALILGSSCDDDPPPESPCTIWLTCYATCRDRVSDDLTHDEAWMQCEDECGDERAAVEHFQWDFDTQFREETLITQSFFWGTMAFCLNDGAPDTST
jgi:hypothetical protein